MLVYRISKCRYINDLSGQGAASFPGRLNGKGMHVLYTAATPSLALLESVVHISNIPALGYCMITLDVPDVKMLEVSVNDLPEDWNTNPPAARLKEIGNAFLREGTFLALKIPSAIIPEEFNILFNPNHREFNQVKVLSNRSLSFDERLLRK